MTRAFPNPVVNHMLTLADELAQRGGVQNFSQVARPRAVSSGYYAVFHALCYVCSDGLVRWSRTNLVHEVYRFLDHGVARRRLADAAARAIHPSVKDIGAAFRDLQDARHSADYAPSIALFTRTEALSFVRRACEAVRLIHDLDAEARTRLAILLVVNKRAA